MNTEWLLFVLLLLAAFAVLTLTRRPRGGLRTPNVRPSKKRQRLSIERDDR